MGDKRQTIFLTGATGLVASYILKLFLEDGHKVFCLARSRKDKSASDRVIELLKFWDSDILSKVTMEDLIICEGDITSSDLDLSSEDKSRIIDEAEIIFHSAALAELRVDIDIIRKINVKGTQNVLDLALECKKLQKVNHISTAYVVGKKGDFEWTEDMLDVGQTFHNTYEQSKYEAEVLVHEYRKKGLNISIFRPSMVMGDSQEGKTNNFRLIYEPLHFLSKGIYEKFPANMDCWQNLINIDITAKAIFTLGTRAEMETHHIVSPQPTKVQYFLEVAAKYFGFKLPEFIPLEDFDFSEWTAVQKILAQPFVPYFNYKTKFISEKTQAILKEYGFTYPEIDEANLKVIYGFCNKEGFIKQGSYK